LFIVNCSLFVVTYSFGQTRRFAPTINGRDAVVTYPLLLTPYSLLLTKFKIAKIPFFIEKRNISKKKKI